MAKKTDTIAEEKITEIPLSGLSITELINYKEGVEALIRLYDNKIQGYMNSFRGTQEDRDLFKEFNKKHSLIMNEISKRVRGLYA